MDDHEPGGQPGPDPQRTAPPSPPGPADPGCPGCAAPLSASTTSSGLRRCGSCRLLLTGPVAAQLWQADQELERASIARRTLMDTLRALSARSDDQLLADSSLLAAPAPVPGVTHAGARPGASAASAHAVPGPVPRSPQQLLLTLGVLMLLVAASVFLAVAWRTLGVAGQAAVLAAVTVATGAGAFWASSRHLDSRARSRDSNQRHPPAAGGCAGRCPVSAPAYGPPVREVSVHVPVDVLPDGGLLFAPLGALQAVDGDEGVLCHACGEALAQLSAWHLGQHGLTVSAYRERFGLNRKQSLLAPALAERRREEGRRRLREVTGVREGLAVGQAMARSGTLNGLVWRLSLVVLRVRRAGRRGVWVWRGRVPLSSRGRVLVMTRALGPWASRTCRACCSAGMPTSGARWRRSPRTWGSARRSCDGSCPLAGSPCGPAGGRSRATGSAGAGPPAPRIGQVSLRGRVLRVSAGRITMWAEGRPATCLELPCRPSACVSLTLRCRTA